MPDMGKIQRFYHTFSRRMSFIGRWQLASSAAGTAFWFFLSLVPIVILCVSILPYTPLTEEQVIRAFSSVFPEAFSELIRSILSDIYSTSVGVLSLSALATLWSAARGFSSLIWGLELVYEQKKRSAYLPRRLRGMLYTLFMLLALVLTIALGGFGRQLMWLAEKYLPGSRRLFTFLLHFRFLVVIFLLTVFFCAIYRWSTDARPHFGQLFPGALLAAGGWSLFSWAFSAWVRLTGGLSSTYGSLATVVVVMLWLYYCQYILLLGACFNRALPGINRRMEERKNGRDANENGGK